VSQDTSRRRKVLLPHDLTPDHLLGFLELLHSLGGSIDSMYVGDSLNENVSMLPHAIDVAEALGLVAQEHGNLQITEAGRRIVKGDPKSVRRELRKLVDKIEPLGELVNLLREKASLSIDEFMELVEKYYPGNAEEAAKNLLIWGAFLHLFKMDEDDEEIRPF